MLCFSIQVFAEKEELGKGSYKDLEASKSKRNCSLLMDWVNSDLQDKPFNIGFSNVSRKCLAENKKAHDKLTGNKTNAIIETKDLGSFYSQKLKNKISETKQDKYLNACRDAVGDETKKRSLQTRFYAVAAKMETANSTIVDEIAFYDSVLPSPYDSVLRGIDCKTAFLEINKKCDEYKKQTKDCKSDPSTRFENLVKKTKDNLKRIEELEKAHRLCLRKTGFKYKSDSPHSTQTNEKCRPLFQATELLKDQTPWVRGEVFSSIAIKTKPSYRNNYQTEYDEEKITPAISDQLNKNRQALVRTFNTNTNNFQCLINNNVDDPECDFKKIRSHVSSQPDIKASSIFSTNSIQDKEAIIQIDSDQCLMKFEDDLYQLHNTIKDVGYTVVLTAATLGVGWASGLKAINSVSKLGRSLAIANGTFGVATLGVGLSYTYKECSPESKLVIDLSTQENLTKENMCSLENSPLSQAQEKETDCILSALLTAPGILPFLGSTPSLMKLARASSSINRSAKSTTRVSTDVVKSNASQMQSLVKNDPTRAKELIKSQMKDAGFDMTDAQVDAILKAHTDPSAACVIGKCTPAQLAKKVEFMDKAGLTPTQRRVAIERGLAGNESNVSLPKINSDEQLNQLFHDNRYLVNKMSLEEIDEATRYLKAKIEKVPPKDKLSDQFRMDTDRLKELEKIGARKREHIESQEKFRAVREEYQAQQAAKELRIRRESGIGAPLTSEQSDQISQLTLILESSKPNHLTPVQIKEINETAKYLQQKSFWYDKKNDIGGLVKEDNEKVHKFVKALDDAVTKIRNGSSNADKLAKEQNRILTLPTVERNIQQPNGTFKRETVISAGGARNASKDGEKITGMLKLVNPSTINLRNLESFVKFQPVISKQKEFTDLANKLKPHGVTVDELRDANIASTLNLQGLERNSLYSRNTFELVEKINELKHLDKWSEVERSLTDGEKKLLDNLFKVADDHYQNFRGDYTHKLKKSNEHL